MGNSIGDPRTLEEVEKQFCTKDGDIKDKLSINNSMYQNITDFTHHNKFANRPVHPFPSTIDILKSIPHDAVYFLKMDFVHGYFQLALSEESPILTTFLLQQGKFKYLRAPIGLNAFSDEWCCHSDRMVISLP